MHRLKGPVSVVVGLDTESGMAIGRSFAVHNALYSVEENFSSFAVFRRNSADVF
jgi:hypothetical protein